MSTYVMVLAMMLLLSPSLDPTTRHGDLAKAIADVSETRPALYVNDDTRRRTVALLVAISFRESSLKNEAVGDKGQSFCAFQIHRSIGGHEGLTRDPKACVSMAYDILRQSIAIDRLHPVAFYARGPRHNTPEAHRLSNDRVAIANRLAHLME